MGVACIHTMGSGIGAIVVACLLIKWMSAVRVIVDGVAGVDSIERLRIIVAKKEVVRVLR